MDKKNCLSLFSSTPSGRKEQDKLEAENFLLSFVHSSFDSINTEEGINFTNFLASERGCCQYSSSTRTTPSEDVVVDQVWPWPPSPFPAHQACASGKATHQNAGCASFAIVFPFGFGPGRFSDHSVVDEDATALCLPLLLALYKKR